MKLIDSKLCNSLLCSEKWNPYFAASTWANSIRNELIINTFKEILCCIQNKKGSQNVPFSFGVFLKSYFTWINHPHQFFSRQTKLKFNWFLKIDAFSETLFLFLGLRLRPCFIGSEMESKINWSPTLFMNYSRKLCELGHNSHLLPGKSPGGFVRRTLIQSVWWALVPNL